MRITVVVVLMSVFVVTVWAPQSEVEHEEEDVAADSSHSVEPATFREVRTPKRTKVQGSVDRIQLFFIRLWSRFTGIYYHWAGKFSDMVAHAGFLLDSLSHYAVQGRVAKAMAQVPREGSSLEDLAKAFAEGVHSDFVAWIPKDFPVPDMKIRYQGRCMYGMQGKVSDFSTIQLAGVTVDYDDDPYDQRINILVRYKLQTMTLSYETSQITPKVKGLIKFQIQQNEVEFGWNIPSIGEMSVSFFKPKCLVILRSFHVKDLTKSKVTLTSTSTLASIAKTNAKTLIDAKEYKFKNIVRRGALEAFLGKLESEDTHSSTWICKSKAFEASLGDAEKDVRNQASDVPTEKFCTKAANSKTPSSPAEAEP